jgi:hypothetical protein
LVGSRIGILEIFMIAAEASSIGGGGGSPKAALVEMEIPKTVTTNVTEASQTSS